MEQLAWAAVQPCTHASCPRHALIACIMTQDFPRRLNQGLTKRAAGLRIGTVLPKCGPVAQLGARFHGMEEVTGSIPVRSTNNPLHTNGLPSRLACVYRSRRC